MIAAVSRRFPHLISFAIVARSFARSTWPKVYVRKPAYDYPDLAPEIGGPVPIWDDALNLFVRVQAERRYPRIVEIGTMNGRRAIALKKLFPEAGVFGLDINRTIASQDFAETEGVRFGPFSPEFFTAHPGGLMVCRGTLNYFAPAALAEFLSTVFDSGYDVAFVEPSMPFTPPPGARRGPDCWYYDWPAVMRAAGFEVEHGAITKYRFNLSRTEAWHANLATSATHTGRLYPK